MENWKLVKTYHVLFHPPRALSKENQRFFCELQRVFFFEVEPNSVLVFRFFSENIVWEFFYEVVVHCAFEQFGSSVQGE